MDTIIIQCSVPSELDEHGANGLWDLAGHIALSVGYELRAQGILPTNAPVYAEELGQETIYNILRSFTEEETEE